MVLDVAAHLVEHVAAEAGIVPDSVHIAQDAVGLLVADVAIEVDGDALLQTRGGNPVGGFILEDVIEGLSRNVMLARTDADGT